MITLTVMGRPKSSDPRETVSIRVPTSTLKEIDSWAKQHDMSRSTLMRHIMQAGVNNLGITNGAPKPMPATPGRGHPSGGFVAARDLRKGEK